MLARLRPWAARLVRTTCVFLACIFAVCVLIACGNTTASAQTTVTGTVRDMVDASPIPGAYVDVRTPEGLNPHVQIDAYTDAEGRYVLAGVPAGRWRVRLIYSDGPDAEHILVTPKRADSSGVYRISRIDPGTYTIRVVYADAALDLPGVSVEPGTSELNVGL